MPPYRASLGGAFGGGVQRQPGQVLDISGAIDAVTGGAAGLIHQAYTRRAQEHEMQRQDAQLQLEREKEERQIERDRLQARGNGVVAGETTIERTPAAAPAAPPAPMSIRDAMQAGLTGPAAPTSPLLQPRADGLVGSMPGVRVTETPDHYDPEQDGRRIRILDGIGARGAVQSTIEEQRQGGRVALEGVRQGGRMDRDAARHTFKLEEQADAAGARASLSAAHDGRVTARANGAAGGAGRPLTANGKEVAKRLILDGLVSYHADEVKLRDYLTNDEVGKGSVERYGITDADIGAALGRAQNHVRDQVVHAAGSGSPERAARRVRAARDAATAPATAPGAAPANAPASGAAHGLPPLSKAERDRAAADPDYKAFKISKGYKF